MAIIMYKMDIQFLHIFASPLYNRQRFLRESTSYRIITNNTIGSENIIATNAIISIIFVNINAPANTAFSNNINPANIAPQNNNPIMISNKLNIISFPPLDFIFLHNTG